MSASPGRIPHEWCARGLREPPGSDAQITLDLIRDIAVDREQAGLIKLRLSNVRSRFLTVVVTERQFQALRLLRRAVVRREVTVYTGDVRVAAGGLADRWIVRHLRWIRPQGMQVIDTQGTRRVSRRHGVV